MRKYIDILNESLIKEETLNEDIMASPEDLLRKIVQVWDSTKGSGMAEIRLDELFDVVEEIRSFLGDRDRYAKSRDFKKGQADAMAGRAFDPPMNAMKRGEYETGWNLGRKQRGL